MLIYIRQIEFNYVRMKNIYSVEKISQKQIIQAPFSKIKIILNIFYK